MNEQTSRQILDELRGLRADVRDLKAEVRKLAADGDAVCPKCGGELEDTSTFAGLRATCLKCGHSFAGEVVNG